MHFVRRVLTPHKRLSMLSNYRVYCAYSEYFHYHSLAVFIPIAGSLIVCGPIFHLPYTIRMILAFAILHSRQTWSMHVQTAIRLSFVWCSVHFQLDCSARRCTQLRSAMAAGCGQTDSGTQSVSMSANLTISAASYTYTTYCYSIRYIHLSSSFHFVCLQL